jgi:hypothetical protein
MLNVFQAAAAGSHTIQNVIDAFSEDISANPLDFKNPATLTTLVNQLNITLQSYFVPLVPGN